MPPIASCAGQLYPWAFQVGERIPPEVEMLVRCGIDVPGQFDDGDAHARAVDRPAGLQLVLIRAVGEKRSRRKLDRRVRRDALHQGVETRLGRTIERIRRRAGSRQAVGAGRDVNGGVARRGECLHQPERD